MAKYNADNLKHRAYLTREALEKRFSIPELRILSESYREWESHRNKNRKAILDTDLNHMRAYAERQNLAFRDTVLNVGDYERASYLVESPSEKKLPGKRDEGGDWLF